MTDPLAQVAELRAELATLEATIRDLNETLPITDAMNSQVADAIATFRTTAVDIERNANLMTEEATVRIYRAITEVRELREDFDMVVERLGKTTTEEER